MALVERQNAVRGFVANGDKSFQEKIDQQSKAYDEAIAHWNKIAPEDAAKIAAIEGGRRRRRTARKTPSSS